MDLRTLDDASIRRRYRTRMWFGLCLLLLLVGPAAVGSHLAIQGLHNRPAHWIPPSDPVRREFDDFTRRFSVPEVVYVSWPGARLGAPQLSAATELLRPLVVEPALPRRPGDAMDVADQDRTPPPLDLVRSSTASQLILELADAFDAPPIYWARSGDDFLETMTSPPSELPRAASIKRLSGSLIGPDGEQTCLLISLTESGIDGRRLLLPTIREALAALLQIEPDEIAMVGGPQDGAVIDEASIRTIRTFSPPSAILAALICLFCLRSIVLTLVITVVAVVGEGLVMTAVHLTGTPMNAVLIVLPPLVFVLTVSSGIHLSNYFLDAVREFPRATVAQAAAIAMRAGTVPCLMATSTTVIGLGSLILVQLQPIRIFGIVASLGVAFTLLLLLLVLPGAMLFSRGGDPLRANVARGVEETEYWLSRRIRLALRQMLESPWRVIVVFGLAMLILMTGLPKLETSVNVPRMFGANHPLRVQYAWFEQHLGPTVNGELLIRFPPAHGDSDPIARLKLVRQVHTLIAQTEPVGGVLSAVSFLPPIPTARGLSATASRGVIRSQLTGADSPLIQLGFLSSDEEAEVWRVSFNLPLTTHTDYGTEIEAVGDAARRVISLEWPQGDVGDAVDGNARANETPIVVTTGGAKIVQQAQEVLLRDLFRSFLTAFGVVALVMMVLLRGVRGGLIAMIPNVFPTVALFGLMGLARIPLDIGSVMTASVALGIAVDDTIHLLSRFGSRRGRGMQRTRAAWGALRQCGQAMLHTTLVCGLSLMIYGLSDFVPTRRFALLMFGLLSMALLGDLLFLPALMTSRLGRWLSRPLLADPGAELSAGETDLTVPIDARRPTFEDRTPRQRDVARTENR